MSEPKETRLSEMLRLYLSVRRLDMRSAADEIGVSAATVQRITAGYKMSGDTLLKLMAWMVGEQV